ncbi:ankyrin-1-like [Cotesia glomerata]|uniref:ankyrin-1-like n=1 Tax=Cotesia glomerata TaxID=32391 RepID=UPI001D016526|nr:ankyrin-1-like [Cotesia glomerata]
MPTVDITEINLKVARYLLERRAISVDTLADDEHLPVSHPTLLHIAIWNADEKLFHYLMDKGASIHKSFEVYGSALHLAVYKATWNLRIIDWLIQVGAPINAREFSRQWTPLHVACCLGRDDIVMLLLARGADINSTISSGIQVRLPSGDTPLHVAIEFNQERIVELLCRCKADVNFASVYRGTPLPFAVAIGNFKIVQLLINYGANIDYVSTIQESAGTSLILGAEGDFPLTALHVAVKLQNKEMVEILLINGAACDMSVGTLGTPLYCAVEGIDSKIVHHLLNAGAGTKILRREKLAIQKLIRQNHPGITLLSTDISSFIHLTRLRRYFNPEQSSSSPSSTSSSSVPSSLPPSLSPSTSSSVPLSLPPSPSPSTSSSVPSSLSPLPSLSTSSSVSLSSCLPSLKSTVPSSSASPPSPSPEPSMPLSSSSPAPSSSSSDTDCRHLRRNGGE